MKLSYIIIGLMLVAVRCKLTSCVPMGKDNDDERDVNFLINKIQEAIVNASTTVIDLKSDENVIHYDDNGDPIKTEKVPTKHVDLAKDQKNHQEIPDNHINANAPQAQTHHESSEVDRHAIRYDKNGESFEEYKETSEEHEQDHHEEAPQRRKKKKKTTAGIPVANKDRKPNSVINEHFVKKQIQNNPLPNEDDDDYDEDEEDDVPLITIPMQDVLKQYQRMKQGYVSETEEYTEEKEDVLANPHVKNILRRISEEKKKLKENERKGKAVKKVVDHLMARSDEDL